MTSEGLYDQVQTPSPSSPICVSFPLIHFVPGTLDLFSSSTPPNSFQDPTWNSPLLVLPLVIPFSEVSAHNTFS